jgi:hypothetical protein
VGRVDDLRHNPNTCFGGHGKNLRLAIKPFMDPQTRIRKIMESTNCSYDIAQAADEEAGGDLPRATEIAKKKMNLLFAGGRSGQYMREREPRKHITQYKNGILVEDKFYDFSADNNIRLKKMLEKKTFDASILGEDGETTEVIYSEKLDEEYSAPDASPRVRRSGFVGVGKKLGRSKCLEADVPEEMVLAEDGDVLFRAMVGSRKATVRMRKTQTVRDFLAHMRRYCSGELRLTMDGLDISGDREAGTLANETVILSKK